MAGNSKRKGAVRKPGTKKGPTVGSGDSAAAGWRVAAPPRRAHKREYHPAAKAAKRAAKQRAYRTAKRADESETVLGRNPVLECLRAGIPATALYVALGAEADERLTESVTRAADSGLPILEVPRSDLDKMTTNGLHQGIALQVPRMHTPIPTICWPPRGKTPRPRCWSLWTTSPIRAISVPSCAR